MTHEMVHLAFPSMSDQHNWRKVSPPMSSRSRAPTRARWTCRQYGANYGLQDALRAILNAGGNVEVEDWPLERALKAGDEGVGVPVLTELYDRMKAAPADTDLSALWKKLGVQTSGKTVTFDNSAPWAEIRRAITARPREVNE